MQRGPPTWNDERQATGGLSPVVSRARARRPCALLRKAIRRLEIPRSARPMMAMGLAAPRSEGLDRQWKPHQWSPTSD